MLLQAGVSCECGCQQDATIMSCTETVSLHAETPARAKSTEHAQPMQLDHLTELQDDATLYSIYQVSRR